MVLYYVENDLFKVIVDMQTQSYAKTMVEPGVRSFVCDENLLVLEKPAGLFWLDSNRGTPPVSLLQGAIQDYAATIEDGACYILAGVHNDDALDFRTIVADSGFTGIQDTLIIGKTRDSYLKTI